MNTHVAKIIFMTAVFYVANVNASDPVNGKKLYTSIGCYLCHGGVGQGATPTGPRLAPNPVPLEEFLKVLRTPRNVMPPYAASLLPDEAVADIRAFLTTIPQPPAKMP
jgi:ubiquinol-cytochrome c reductase cytochrome c subunit